MKPRALLVCSESSNHLQTGISKRIFQIANLLRDDYQISLATPNPEDLIIDSSIPLLSLRDSSFPSQLKTFELLYASAHIYPTIPGISSFQGKRLLDLYTPFFLEHDATLQKDFSHSCLQRAWLDRALLVNSLQDGDLFLSGSPEQGHLYRGQLELIRPIHTPGIVELPFVLYPRVNQRSNGPFHLCWVGGMWKWFEPDPLLEVLPDFFQNSDCRLSIVGAKHPFDPQIHNQETLNQFEALSDTYPERVQILPWLSFDQYIDFLKTVDGAIVLHRDTPEATYCLRTRFCELLELGIPLICSKGGFYAKFIEEKQIGYVIEENSSQEVQIALQKMVDSKNGLAGSFAPIYAAFSFPRLQCRLREALLKPVRKKEPQNPYLNISTVPFFYERFRILEAWRRDFRFFFLKAMKALITRLSRWKISQYVLKLDVFR